MLGKVWTSHGGHAGHMRFAIRPPATAPTSTRGPILANWAQLQKALHPQGANAANALLGATASDVFLLSRPALERTVLSDPGITITGCARGDVASGAVDHRVLAVLAFLSRSGLKPTVGALRCGQSQYTSSGTSSPHHRGDAVDITAINGVPLTPPPGAGHDHRPDDPGAADAAERIRAARNPEPHALPRLARDEGGLLALEPRRADLRQASRAAAGREHAGSVAHSAGKGKAAPAPVVTTSVLSPLQWTQLVTRIGAIPAPKIVHKPSSSAIADPKQK